MQGVRTKLYQEIRTREGRTFPTPSSSIPRGSIKSTIFIKNKKKARWDLVLRWLCAPSRAGSRKYSLHIPWPWRILRANGQVHLLLFLLPNTALNLALDNSSLPHLFPCSIGAKVLCRQSIFPSRIFFTILCYRRKKKMRKSLKRNIMEKLTAIQIPVFIFSHLSLLHLEWREGKVGYSV